jgi:hypothetical protein
MASYVDIQLEISGRTAFIAGIDPLGLDQMSSEP